MFYSIPPALPLASRLRVSALAGLFPLRAPEQRFNQIDFGEYGSPPGA
jgi:hypothetical protein